MKTKARIVKFKTNSKDKVSIQIIDKNNAVIFRLCVNEEKSHWQIEHNSDKIIVGNYIAVVDTVGVCYRNRAIFVSEFKKLEAFKPLIKKVEY